MFKEKIKENKTIVITGGHLTPALAVLDELLGRGYKNILWFGHKHTMLFDRSDSFEYKEVLKRGIKFIEIKAGKLYVKFSWKGLISLLCIPYGFLQTIYYFNKVQPEFIMSFGGHLALPVVVAAWLYKVPVVTHEQTVVVGRANKIIQKFACKVFLSWEQSLDYVNLKEHKYIISGNPVRKEIFLVKSKKFEFTNSKKTIYITGGNQGSHILTKVIIEILSELLEKYNVIHQCGANTLYNDYEKLRKCRSELQYHLQSSYIVQKGFWGEEIGAVFNKADLLVSRSGANIITEILTLMKPCVLIPIPFSANNEQYLNARMIEKINLGRIIDQKDLTPKILMNRIDEVMSYKVGEAIENKIKNLLKPGAEEIIADEVEKILNERKQ